MAPIASPEPKSSASVTSSTGKLTLRSPSPVGIPADTAAGWGHWMSDGLYGTGDLPSPSTRYTVMSRDNSPEMPRASQTVSMSLLDGTGADVTQGLPDDEASKNWVHRSMPHMADSGTIPAGLPLGLTDNEKKLWLAIYCRARELLKDDGATVRQAVDLAIGDVTEKHSLEYRFAVRWNHSVKTCLAMRQNYRSSDVYS